MLDAGQEREERSDRGSNYTYHKPASKTRRVEFAARFLADDALRDATAEPELYNGPYAGFSDFQKVEVRNFAAHEVGELLHLATKPKPDWSPEEWASFRDEVALTAKKATSGD